MNPTNRTDVLESPEDFGKKSPSEGFEEASQPTRQRRTAKEHVLRTERRLWEMKAELRSYSALLCSLGTGIALEEDDLLGLGLALERVAKRLEKILRECSEVI
jgi:hypothetical protein